MANYGQKSQIWQSMISVAKYGPILWSSMANYDLMRPIMSKYSIYSQVYQYWQLWPTMVNWTNKASITNIAKNGNYGQVWPRCPKIESENNIKRINVTNFTWYGENLKAES